jgi:hypothetical protein
LGGLALLPVITNEFHQAVVLWKKGD